MVCSIAKTLLILKQLESSPVLPQREHSLVRALAASLEYYEVAECGVDTVDTELNALKSLLVSAEVERLSMADVGSVLTEFYRRMEVAIPAAEASMTALEQNGLNICTLVEVISSWLPDGQEFLQPGDITREVARARLRHSGTVLKLQEIGKLLEDLHALESLDEGIRGMSLW